MGIDTYSFHRLLGHLRDGEEPSANLLGHDDASAIRLAARFGVDVIAAQTCFMRGAPNVDLADLVQAATPAELVPSWGAPSGLEYGANTAATADLEWWIDASADVGCRLVRIVLGGPSTFGLEPDEARTERVLPVLERVARLATRRGVRLAIENHGDTCIAHVVSILERLGQPAVGSCFDTANALRAGDDPVAAARLVEPWVMMLHLKDVEPLANQRSHVSGPCSVPYGEGVVALDDVLDALSRPIDAGAPVCVELGQLSRDADESAMIAASLDWLRERAVSRG